MLEFLWTMENDAFEAFINAPSGDGNYSPVKLQRLHEYEAVIQQLLDYFETQK